MEIVAPLQASGTGRRADGEPVTRAGVDPWPCTLSQYSGNCPSGRAPTVCPHESGPHVLPQVSGPHVTPHFPSADSWHVEIGSISGSSCKSATERVRGAMLYRLHFS